MDVVTKRGTCIFSIPSFTLCALVCFYSSSNFRLSWLHDRIYLRKILILQYLWLVLELIRCDFLLSWMLMTRKFILELSRVDGIWGVRHLTLLHTRNARVDAWGWRHFSKFPARNALSDRVCPDIINWNSVLFTFAFFLLAVGCESLRKGVFVNEMLVVEFRLGETCLLLLTFVLLNRTNHAINNGVYPTLLLLCVHHSLPCDS